MPFGLPDVSFGQIFRLVQTLAMPLIFAAVVQQVSQHFSSPKEEPKASRSLYAPMLQDIGFGADANFPVTYIANATSVDQHAERIDSVPSTVHKRPDTTAVILNWARFPNVLLITSMMCSPGLDGIIAQVLIWNNTPMPLTYDVRPSSPHLVHTTLYHTSETFQRHGMPSLEVEYCQRLRKCTIPRTLSGMLQSRYSVLLRSSMYTAVNSSSTLQTYYVWSRMTIILFAPKLYMHFTHACLNPVHLPSSTSRPLKIISHRRSERFVSNIQRLLTFLTSIRDLPGLGMVPCWRDHKSSSSSQ